MRRRTVGAFIALALLAGGTAQAVPPATGSPILGADTVVYSDRSASMTVQVPQAFHLNPWLFDVPASGYESDWCVYSGGPPPLGYQPRCLGGSGLGTAQLGPLVNYDYCGFSAFLGIPWTQPLAVSRSLQGTGLVYDETAMFIWLRLPPIRSHYQAHGSTTARAVVRISNGVNISAK